MAASDKPSLGSLMAVLPRPWRVTWASEQPADFRLDFGTPPCDSGAPRKIVYDLANDDDCTPWDTDGFPCTDDVDRELIALRTRVWESYL